MKLYNFYVGKSGDFWFVCGDDIIYFSPEHRRGGIPDRKVCDLVGGAGSVTIQNYYYSNAIALMSDTGVAHESLGYCQQCGVAS
jgi:hypothetical protein